MRYPKKETTTCAPWFLHCSHFRPLFRQSQWHGAAEGLNLLARAWSTATSGMGQNLQPWSTM